MAVKLKYPFIDGYADLPLDKGDQIRELRKWLQTQPHLPEISNDYLHLFLHSNYYDMEETKLTIEKFYMIRSSHPEIFTNRSFKNQKLLDQMDIGRFGALPKKTPQGYQVIVIGQTKQVAKFNHTECTKGMFAAIDVTISENGLCPGYIIVFDNKNFTFSHFVRLSYNAMRATMEYIQDGIPIRVKHMIIINAVPFIDKVYALFKPFMKPSLIDMLKIYDNDLTEFYKIVPKDCLYEDYGGPWGTLESAHENFVKLLETKYSKWLEDDSIFTVDMTLKDKAQKKSFFSFW